MSLRAVWRSVHRCVIVSAVVSMLGVASEGAPHTFAQQSHSTVSTAVSLEVSPGSVSVPRGGSQLFVATATLEDGSTQDVTNLAAWSSSDPSVATADASGF